MSIQNAQGPDRETSPDGATERLHRSSTTHEHHESTALGSKSSAQRTPFADGADALKRAGWADPLPMPYGKKKAPPTGYTGRGGIRPSGADTEEWKADRGGYNIAGRLAADVIGIDVDDYGNKHGAQTLATFEAEHGPLAPTYRLTSRPDEVNGIRLHRLPEDVDESELVDMGTDVETIRASYRYVTAGGSVHPEGRVYEYVAPDGTRSLTPPRKEDLPVLTAAQVDGLRRKEAPATAARDDVSTVDLEEALQELQNLQPRLKAYLPSEPKWRADVAPTANLKGGDKINGWSWEKRPDGRPGLLPEACVRAIQLDATAAAIGEPEIYVSTLLDEFAKADRAIGDRTKEGQTRLEAAEDKIKASHAEAAKRGPAMPRDVIEEERAKARFSREASTSVAVLDAPEAEPHDAPVGGELHSGQVRMAYRLAMTYKGRLLDVHGMGWHYWTGTHFAEDKGSARATKAVLDVIGRALRESVGDKELRQDAVKCSSASGVAGVLSIAAALDEFHATVDDIDVDPHLLNTRSGTLDLRTMELRPHDPADRLTKVTGAAYVPEADQGFWLTFLERVLPDAEERAYLQRVVGQSLKGDVEEHLFPVLRGEGRNGKGKFYEAVTRALGAYAVVIDPALLMETKSDRSQGPEMMVLIGARIVFASETKDGKSLDEALMKRLTGGDALTARNLYKPPVTWEPSHQIVYVTNHLPKVKGDDPAVWARIRVIPFDVVIPKPERNLRLGRDLALHLEAILAWAVEGLVDYEARGMAEPDSVVMATESYQQDSDPVARFLEEECVYVEGGPLGATTGALHTAYLGWARRSAADQSVSDKALSASLTRLNFTSKKTERGKAWHGLNVMVEHRLE